MKKKGVGLKDIELVFKHLEHNEREARRAAYLRETYNKVKGNYNRNLTKENKNESNSEP